MADSPPLLRRARPDEASVVTDLALRSKRLWDYSDDFMEAVAPDMAFTPEDIEADRVEVLESEHGLVGFMRLQRRPDEAWLQDLFIDPQAVRKGHGQRLFERAVAGLELRRDALRKRPYAKPFYLMLGAARVGFSPSSLIPGQALPLKSYRL